MLILNHFVALARGYVHPRRSKSRMAAAKTRLLAELLENRLLLHTRLDMTHVHLEPTFVNGIWGLEANDTSTGVHYDASDVLLHANSNTRDTQPAGWDFIGAGDGNTYWHLTQNVNPDILTLALDGGQIASGTFDRIQHDDPRIGREAEWIKLSLFDFSGPGDFSVWQTTQAPTQWWMSTADAGQTYDPALYLEPGGHTHYNFGFTAVGIYTVTLQISALQGGKEVPSAPIPVCFGVEVKDGCEGNAPSPRPVLATSAVSLLNSTNPQSVFSLLPRATVPAVTTTTPAEGRTAATHATLDVPGVDQLFASSNRRQDRNATSSTTLPHGTAQLDEWQLPRLGVDLVASQ